MDFAHASFVLIFLSCVALSQQCTRHGVSCPNYTVIATHEGYEERLYEPLVWATTSGKAKVRNEISRRLIKRLYAYIGGANDREERMEMMVPFRTTKIPAEDQNTYIISIPLAPRFQENPPNPTNRLVTVVREPERTYFARSFGGRIREESRFDQEAQTLRSSLQGTDAANSTFFYWGAYDSPWTPDEDRLNEVWLSPSDSSST